MLKHNLAENLKYIRKANKLTQEKMSEMCAISPRYLRKLEYGTASATIDVIEHISKRFNISAGALLEENLSSKNISWSK